MEFVLNLISTKNNPHSYGEECICMSYILPCT